ncbi:hypothetical protein BKA66DRAFT_117590 [Pyrenochaeta sp. MPI-SDFR-AT-0127]|nr:hypothetical protein BKA66DRAFT_117590 [Pyrenochaeta sp. MPI-SDFR-AT-0127]
MGGLLFSPSFVVPCIFMFQLRLLFFSSMALSGHGRDAHDVTIYPAFFSIRIMYCAYARALGQHLSDRL